MPLNPNADLRGSGVIRADRQRTAAVGDIIKFPDEGRIVRFGRAGAQDESATVIILPVIRIRCARRRSRAAQPSANSQLRAPPDETPLSGPASIAPIRRRQTQAARGFRRAYFARRLLEPRRF